MGQKKVLIGFIGRGNYQEATYEFKNVKQSSKLVTKVIAEYIKPDEIYMIGTDKSDWGLVRDVLKRDFNEVRIPFGYNEDEFWSIFDALVSLNIEESELHMDITHGFRSLPLFVSTAISFFREVKSVDVRGLYYGIFETNDEVKPIIDLLPILQLSHWINAYSLFKNYGDLAYVIELIQQFYKNLSEDKKREFSYLKSIVNILNKTNISFGFTAIEAFNRNQKSLSNLLKENKDKFDDLKNLKPVKFLFNSLLESAEKYVALANQWQKQLLLAEEYYNKNRYAQSITVLREFILTFVLEELQQDWKDIDLREDKLSKIVFTRDAKQLFSEQFSSIASKIKEYRNKINHAYIRGDHSEEITDDDRKEIGELIRDIKILVEKYQEKEEEVFKNKDKLLEIIKSSV